MAMCKMSKEEKRIKAGTSERKVSIAKYQANMQFTALTSTVIAALSLLVAATPTPEVMLFNHLYDCLLLTLPGQANLITIEQFKDWLDNTDADITFIGKPLGDLSDLSKRNALETTVTYCTHRTDQLCGGTCVVYNGGATCIDAPGTQCLAATNNVGFCDRGGCGGSCNQFSSCGTRLDNNFCYTPGTASILVGTA